MAASFGLVVVGSRAELSSGCSENPKDGPDYDQDSADRVQQAYIKERRKQHQDHSGDNHSVPFRWSAWGLPIDGSTQTFVSRDSDTVP